MDVMNAIQMRKSIRKFISRQVSDEDLNKILMAGNEAPVGGAAFDTVHMTVVRNNTLLQQIEQSAAKAAGREPNPEPFHGAPTVIFVCTRAGQNPNTQYANAACLVENMCLTATALSLGSVYIWGALSAFDDNPELISKLQIPEGFRPVSAAAIGYPEMEEVRKPKKERKISINYVN